MNLLFLNYIRMIFLLKEKERNNCLANKLKDINYENHRAKMEIERKYGSELK